MGYAIFVDEHLTIEPPLNADEVSYLQDFNGTRRVRRRRGPYAVHDAQRTVDLEVSPAGSADLLDDQRPEPGQPHVWCPWSVSDDGRRLLWDEWVSGVGHQEWLEYLIAHFLTGQALVWSDVERAGEASRFARFTFDHQVSGHIDFEGEDGAEWSLVVEGNRVRRIDRRPPEIDLEAELAALPPQFDTPQLRRLSGLPPKKS